MGSDQPQLLAGRYEIRAMIGRGGMAQVHLGFDTRLSRIVAIKMLRTDLARDSIFQTRFRREAQAAASLNHPNIVAVYDTGEENITTPDGNQVSIPYIVMEYVEGHTVRDLLSGGAPVPIDEAVEIISGVLSALEYSHSMGLVHRDIKPANIMLTNTGKIKVMDFGIARAITDSQATMTQTNAVVGTAQYLSPEQARGETVDERSDLYSTGCVLFELLTGQPPFKGDSAVAVAYQHVSEVPPTPSSITSDVPEAIDRVVLKALAKDKAKRYESAQVMNMDLQHALRGGTVTAPMASVWQNEPTQTRMMNAAQMPAVAPTRVQRREEDSEPQEEEENKSRKGLWITLVLAALVIAGLVATWLFISNRPDPKEDMVTIPTGIVGVTQDEARAQLTDAGLKMVVGDPVADETIPQDSVVSADPKPGSEVKKGSTVTVRLSSGPAAVKVPDLGGLTQSEARDQLEKLGLRIGNVNSVDDPSVDKDRVVSTNPKAGRNVKRGDVVNLNIASGYVTVPDDLTGKSEQEVTDILQKLRLSTRSTQVETSDAQPGTVMDVQPVGSVKIGDTITITVAKAAPTPTPTVTQQPSEEPSEEPSEDPNNNGENQQN
ncbi:Stk1 family PASTA domain-containing Ser/Thr kinase [Gleimia hominis]|uniref:non-specific serine/threonine protein kinase n=1 Tax=Gleimia hominis TaxID=595468 RepID=A0ABU3I9D2_9ACTO|nr:Stk1 family PASTA domain-containing Ser/Thr kinase [Gleimia hominis]MDT3766803.1 Stk1 family PASTA domain-containing Ser/Thr kinase [Gleimia hominis]